MNLTTDLQTILTASVPLMVPLLFAGLGEYVAQRAGTFNLSVEGMMLGSAFAAAYGASASGSPIVGLLCGMLAGLAVAFVHGNLSHRLQLNTYVVGLSLNVLVLGVTNYLLSTTVLDIPGGSAWRIPLLSELPIIGKAFFVQPWVVYLLLPLLFVIWWVRRRRIGLELRAAGDDPVAGDLTGIDVNARRRQALLFCGLCSGIGGAYLSVFQSGSFTSGMTAGRGYIVIAAVIFGGWMLRGVIGACAVFGIAQGLQLALPAIGYSVSPQLLAATPYLLALVSLALLGARSRRPLALGQPFAPAR
ncbi:ABC transporter permease [Nocardioides carbamazepini]|uniref:ABC transporter permease n=1 Tax=Nocardioides carbamazepini TaxID=2854259 RepID=UPI002149F4F8|nr:ABC transporter permease [Nocardioides carbamazepini]MCR1784630.1 ABC transporter permease [Nocardioides carbamazepini]